MFSSKQSRLLLVQSEPDMMKYPFKKPLSILSLLILTAGCATVTVPSTQPVTLPAQFSPALESSATASADSLQTWWTLFEDPLLAGLVERALLHNRDIQTALARVRETRALRNLIAAESLPQLSLGGSVLRDRLSQKDRSADQLGKNPATVYRAGFDASWELDIFSAAAQRNTAASAEVEAALAAGAAMRLSVAAEVATNYFEIRSLQQQIRNLDQLTGAAQQLVALVRVREQRGLASALERLQSEEQLALTSAQQPLLQARLQTAIRRIGILVGADSQALLGQLEPVGSLPAKSRTEVPTLLPAALLERRPDIIAAERQWASALARWAGAEADRMPKFSLSASLGTLAMGSTGLLSSPAQLWALGAMVRAPLYQPALSATAQVQRARAEQAALAYESSVVQAMLDVEASNIRLQQARQREQQLALALAANNEALALSRLRYERGLSDLLTVLDLVRRQLSTEQEWIVAREQSLGQTVALYKALGGGWELPQR